MINNPVKVVFLRNSYSTLGTLVFLYLYPSALAAVNGAADIIFINEDRKDFF